MRDWVPILARLRAAANGIATAVGPSPRNGMPKSDGVAPMILTGVNVTVVVLRDSADLRL